MRPNPFADVRNTSNISTARADTDLPQHRRIRLGLTTSAAEPLDLFPTFIGMLITTHSSGETKICSERMEQPPPPPQAPIPVLNAPTVFPIVTLRSWHPPTKLRDLRFLR